MCLRNPPSFFARRTSQVLVDSTFMYDSSSSKLDRSEPAEPQRADSSAHKSESDPFLALRWHGLTLTILFFESEPMKSTELSKTVS